MSKYKSFFSGLCKVGLTGLVMGSCASTIYGGYQTLEPLSPVSIVLKDEEEI